MRQLLYLAGYGRCGVNQRFSRHGHPYGINLLFTMRLTNGNEMVTGLFLFLAPACGLIIRFMVGYGKQ